MSKIHIGQHRSKAWNASSNCSDHTAVTFWPCLLNLPSTLTLLCVTELPTWQNPPQLWHCCRARSLDYSLNLLRPCHNPPRGDNMLQITHLLSKKFALFQFYLKVLSFQTTQHNPQSLKMLLHRCREQNNVVKARQTDAFDHQKYLVHYADQKAHNSIQKVPRANKKQSWEDWVQKLELGCTRWSDLMQRTNGHLPKRSNISSIWGNGKASLRASELSWWQLTHPNMIVKAYGLQLSWMICASNNWLIWVFVSMYSDDGICLHHCWTRIFPVRGISCD